MILFTKFLQSHLRISCVTWLCAYDMGLTVSLWDLHGMPCIRSQSCQGIVQALARLYPEYRLA